MRQRLLLHAVFALFTLLSFPAAVRAANPLPAQLVDLEIYFGRILGVATSLFGIAAFIMILTGGFKYMTAGGDPKQTASAKQTITWAIAGVVLTIAAWFIIKFIEISTGVPVTLFKVTQ